VDTQTGIILCYLVQIPLSIYALAFMPRRGTLAQPLENARRNSALIGFLPCALGSIMIQVICLGIYYARVKALDAKEARIVGKWSQTSVPDAANGNPFGASSGASSAPQPLVPGNPFASGAAPAAPASANPFATGGGSSAPAPANPFADGVGGGTTTPRDNPFA